MSDLYCTDCDRELALLQDDICGFCADKLQARIAELEAENAKLERLNSAALEKLSYLACPPNRNNDGQPCNESDYYCVACWREYLRGKDD